MAEIKWIKISCDLFNDEAIKLIEQMPEGDAIIVIWLKLLIMAGKINDGGFLYFKKEIPYTDEMLSMVFCRPLNTIRLALKTFENFGMIKITNEQNIFITNWEKYQNIEGMEKIKAQVKERVKRFRDKQKQEQEQALLPCNVTCNVTVTDGNAIDIEEEKELEEEKKKKKRFNAKSSFQELLDNDDEIKEFSSFKDIFLKWLDYKSAIKKQFKTEQGVRTAFMNLVNLSQKNIENAFDIVEYAISKEWQNFYTIPEKDKKILQQQKRQNQSNDIDEWESRFM